MAFRLRSQSPLKQEQGGDMYGSPMIAKQNNDSKLDRSYYNPRTNVMNIGSDAESWADPEKVVAHENFHAKQFKEGRTNYDIGHHTDNEQWAKMQKRPEMMSTNKVWGDFHNRKEIEVNQDINRVAKKLPETQFFRNAAADLIYDKVVDQAQYSNKNSLEGEAQSYEDTGKDPSPLHKQKLSPKAAKDKAVRDLAYAETPDRRAKKADDQRRHRKDPSGKGKDWDHEDGRWEDASQNRGNDGNGTKSEKGKNYKVNKNS